ncbi:flippase [Aliivibrio fischeri]|uniref:flippase n=1 Tax=Aliivibrio fischeri TaxID=668 RepID=UPI002E34A59E|nr:flippase [Aliivibrio fischeri]MCE7577985.1 flippase [Aliivibrio fischeri]MCE7590373.1 flippase [Aliivibrio fischeri]
MKIKQNIIYLLFDKVFLLITSLVLSIYTYRILGPDLIGILNTAQNFWALFAFLLSLGLESIVIKMLIKYTYSKYKILSTAFYLKIIGSILSCILCVVLAYIYNNEEVFFKVILIIVLNGLLNPFTIIDFYYQSKNKANVVVKCRLLSKVIAIIFHVYVILHVKNIYAFATVNVIYNILVTTFYISVYKLDGMKIKMILTKFDLKIGKVIFNSSLPLMFASIAIPIFMQSDVVMINYFLGSYEAGIFSAATKLILPWNLIPTAIVTAFFPLLISLNSSKIDFEEKFKEISSFLFWIAIIFALFVSIFSDEIVSILYGDEFIRANNVLTIQVWSSVIAFLGPIGTRWLIVKKLQKIEFYKTACAAIANILLNIVFIPSLGLIGASITSLISYFIANLLFFLLYKKTRDLFYIYIKSMSPVYAIRFIRNLK